MPSNQRCHATGLILGDCKQNAKIGEPYCYYHTKLQADMCEPTAQLYPVWPLPATGYVLTEAALQAVA